MRFKWIVLGAAVASLTVLAFAQPPGGEGRPGRGEGRAGQMMGGMGMNAGMMLLQRADVQKELNITAEQKAKAEDLQAKQREKMQQLRQNSDQMSPEERRKAMEELRSGSDPASVLNETQKKRLKELEYQWQGPMALMNPQVAKEVGLTNEQTTKMAGIQTQMMENMRGMFQGGGGGGNREEMMKQMQEARAKVEKDIEAVLTPEQKQKWQSMQGKPFTFEGGRGMGMGGFGGGFGNRRDR